MDYECDICKGKESEVGSLSTGRLKSGWDYQVCKGCKTSKVFIELKNRENKEV